MKSQEISQKLQVYVYANLKAEVRDWLNEKTKDILSEKSGRALYLTYTLLAQKIVPEKLTVLENSNIDAYLKDQQINTVELARIFFLRELLLGDPEFAAPHISKIIQIADTLEIETFLKYLILLPNPENYKAVAADALRTNIASVFDALALKNPYPEQYFDDAQWNQMFLKAAFMQRPLNGIVSIDKRANQDLARIISDYAHERWAARRDIDPYFWRPVTRFMNTVILLDMQHLFNSDMLAERYAATLCCYHSTNDEAKKLLANHHELYQHVESGRINWNTIHDTL